MGKKIKSYDWLNLFFFALSPLVAIAAITWSIMHGGPHWASWILFGFFICATGLAITAGYHRLWSHRTYDAKLPMRLIFLFFGTATYQHSVLWWSAEHRVHHRFEDTDRDPYGINKGFWYAHIGWLLEKREEASYDWVKDLQKDPWLRFQDKYFYILSFISCFIVPGLIAALWGDFWNGVIWAGLVRMVVNHHATFCINSLCHYLGKQGYSDQITARDSWISAIITFGEGYHNFHHKFQYDYRNAILFHQWDPTKWLIWSMEKLGLASNLKRASEVKILEARLQADGEHFMQRMSRYSDQVRERAAQLVEEGRVQLEEANKRLTQVRIEYAQAKEQYNKMGREKVSDYQERLKELKLEMKQAKKELRVAFNEWKLMIEGPLPAGA